MTNWSVVCRRRLLHISRHASRRNNAILFLVWGLKKIKIEIYMTEYCMFRRKCDVVICQIYTRQLSGSPKITRPKFFIFMYVALILCATVLM